MIRVMYLYFSVSVSVRLENAISHRIPIREILQECGNYVLIDKSICVQLSFSTQYILLYHMWFITDYLQQTLH